MVSSRIPVRRARSHLTSVIGLAAAGTLVFAPVIPAAADEVENAFSVPIATFTMDDADTGFTGAGAVAHPQGDIELVDAGDGEKATQFSNSFWLDVKKENGTALLEDLDDVRISYEAKSSSAADNQSWSIFASPDAAGQTYMHERYLGIMDSTQKITVERYANYGGGRDVSGNLAADYSSDAWKHVEIEITDGDASLRIDGVEVDSNSNGKPLTELVSGPDSVMQIGRANWSAPGEYFNGLMKNVEIVTTPQSAVKQAINRASIPGFVTADIDLPATGENSVQFTWESSDESVIDAQGKVYPGEEDQTITLTATAALGDSTESRDFSVVVSAALVDIDSAHDALLIPYVLSAGDQLPGTVVGAEESSVEWEASDPTLLDSDDAVVGAPGEDPVEVDLTATLTLGEASATKTFTRVLVMPEEASTLATYTRDASIDGGLRVGNSMHLGLATDGDEFIGLNQNYGVAFAEAEIVTNEANKTQSTSIRGLIDPFLFRMADGKHAYVAILTTEGGSRVNPGQILFSESENLTQWSGKPNEDEIGGLVTVADSTEAFDAGSLTAGWDAAAENYRIGWKVRGVPQYVTTTDFATFSEVKSGPGFAKDTVEDLGIANSIPSNAITIETELSEYLAMKLGRIVNVGLDHPDLTVAAETDLDELIQEVQGGQELENGLLSKGSTATAHYSDGSTFDFRVDWDEEQLAAIDTSQPGEYTVEGEIIQQNYSDDYPFMENRADPNMVYWDGKYYAMGTSDSGNMEVLFIRSSDTVLGLKDQEGGRHEQGGWMVPGQDELLLGPEDGFGHAGYHWAPEMHVVTDSQGNDNLYIFYAAFPADDNDGTGKPYEGPNWMGPAAYVLELKPGADPMKTSSWIEHRALNQDGDHLSDTGLTIDMTYFVVDGQSYLAWSQGNETYAGAKADVTIATTDPDKPWQITSDPVRIIRPEWGWELDGVSEGANVLLNDGKVYMVFSGQMVSPQYATGMLIADQDADLLDPDSWTKSNYPWLHNGIFEGQYGLGHNSYFIDAYGDAFNVYHAIASKDGGQRHAGIVPIHYRADGSPVLDMKKSEELLPEYTANPVLLTVTVEEGSEPTDPDPDPTDPDPDPTDPDPDPDPTDPDPTDPDPINPVDGSELNDENAGDISVPDFTTAGGNVDVLVGSDYAGESVSVWFYSTPTDLGWHTVNAEGTVTVQIPTDAEPGLHRIAAYDVDGNLIGWDSITVLADSGPGDGDDGDGDGTQPGDGDAGTDDSDTDTDANQPGKKLPRTGASVLGLLVLAGLATGGGLVIRRWSRA